jgi:hypothetical protein
MLMKRIPYITEQFEIPSNWTKAECIEALNAVNSVLHDMVGEQEEFIEKHGTTSDDIDNVAFGLVDRMVALEEAIKTR